MASFNVLSLTEEFLPLTYICGKKWLFFPLEMKKNKKSSNIATLVFYGLFNLFVPVDDMFLPAHVLELPLPVW